jgi:hypothetical protein
MEKKMTKRQMFEMIKGVNADNAEIVAFCDKELALLDKKNVSRGETATQKENAVLSNEILDILSDLDKAKTVTELINETEIGKLTFGKDQKAMTNQKLSRLINDLAKDNKVIRVETKGVAYFKIA